MASRLPSILAEQDELPNIMPAGESPQLKAQPSPTWPGSSSGVIPEINTAWLKADLPKEWAQKTGQLLEPGTGFANRGANIALRAPRFQMPLFMGFAFPPFGMPFPETAPPESPGAAQGEEGIDWLGDLMNLGKEALKLLPKGGASPEDFSLGKKSYSPGSEPTGMDLEGNFLDDQGRIVRQIEGTPFFENQFDLEGNMNFDVKNLLDPSKTGFNIEDFSALKPNDYDNLIDSIRQFSQGGESGFNAAAQNFATNTFGKGDPTYGLLDDTIQGAEAANSLTSGMNLGTTTSLISPTLATGAGAALAAAPHVFKQFGWQEGADVAGNPALAAPAGAALAGLGGAATAAPFTFGASMVAVPMILSAMNMLDIGGREKRTAADAASVQGLADNRLKFLQIAQHNPELLPYVGNLFKFGPEERQQAESRLQEIERNGRIPLDAIQRLRQLYTQTDPLVNQISFQPQSVMELLAAPKTESGALPIPQASPTAAQNFGAPALSEGELWKMITTQQRLEAERQIAQQIAEAQARGEQIGHDF